ncbi:MAG: class I SAM-dependent methyltransferase, partial [SAR324 cluster bacterium]|nr:class I SAM-dependent methyltransferase [SAR324 cluster bacterium]
AERLENRLEIKLKDYREVKGMFDFITSIGMFEHVSKPCYGEFMRDLNILLKPNGVGLLHTIALSDPPEIPPDPWIQRHIFPGTRLPRLQEIVEEMNRYGLTIAHVENLKPHYAETLRLWRKKFEQNKRRIRLLRANYDERFLRTWKYYFQSCEAGFRYSSLNVYQILFSKGNRWPFPLQFGSFMVN